MNWGTPGQWNDILGYGTDRNGLTANFRGIAEINPLVTLHLSDQIPIIGGNIVPFLSPQLLYWSVSASNSINSATSWLGGLFDPVDFILTDRLGRRLGYTPELGLLNEIPGAFYTGDGPTEENKKAGHIPAFL